MAQIETVRTAVHATMDDALRDLATFVSFPSVSQLTADPQPLRDCATWLTDQLRARGGRADMYDVTMPDGRPGHPTVMGHWPGPDNAPHVVLYAHYDVMPEGDWADWNQASPYEAVIRNGRMYGRGVADDGAGAIAHLATIDALTSLASTTPEELAAGRATLPCAVTIVFEGEEEIGSPSFSQFLHQHQAHVGGDVLIVADSTNWACGEPVLTTSLRGVIQCFVDVRTLDHPLHSDMYGGVACDATTAMCRLIASLHDDEGNVAIDGLVSYDTTDVEIREEDLRRDAGISAQVPLMGSGSLASRLWTQPSISVIGIDAPSVAESSCTLQPTCRARLSLRTAPGEDTQRAYDALVAHLDAHAPFGIDVTVTVDELCPPCEAPTDSVYVDHAMKALTQAWQFPARMVGLGASIPFVAEYQNLFPDAAVLITGIEDPDSRAHSANESMDVGELERVITSQVLFVTSLVK